MLDKRKDELPGQLPEKNGTGFVQPDINANYESGLSEPDIDKDSLSF